METILAWVSIFASALLAVACLMLYVDGKGQRVTVGKLEKLVAALQRQVTAQDVAIGQMSRALALLVPPDARPTTAHPRAVVGLSRPFQPAPEHVAAARSAHVEAQAWPPVDTTGDRGGINPGDPIPSEGTEDIRARFEAEAEARSQARGLPSTVTEDEPEDEPTKAYTGKVKPRRPTLLGGLAGAVLERPTSSPARTAEAFRKARPSPSSPTLISAGVEPKRDTLTPTDPSAPTLDARIERRWHEKIAAAQEAGKDARHCHAGRCFQQGQDISACECHCDGCALVVRLLVEARQDIVGQDWP